MLYDFFQWNTLFFHSSEILLVVYLMGSLSYGICYNSSSTLSHPSLLNSISSFSNFSFLSLFLFFVIKDFNLYEGVSSFNAIGSGFFPIVIKALLFLTVSFLLVLSRKTLNKQNILKYEYDLLIVFSILGLSLLVDCNDFLILYLAIELQSLSFYVLATFHRNSEYNAEAGVKYFVLGSLSSGLLLFGFSLVYISCGSFYFENIAKLSGYESSLTLSGFGFILVAILFKLGAFPFHQWLCDVYEGSLITITAFFAAVPKVVLFALLIRMSFTVFFECYEYSETLLHASGLASVCFASVAALYQKRLKRLLAYSAISHAGFILLAIGCNSIDSVKSTMIYLSIYIVMTLTVFSIIFLSSAQSKTPKFLINWASFASRNLCIAATFTCLLFSMAGIPPLAGFYSKLCVFGSLISHDKIIIAACIAVFSSIACFYYIRLIRVIFFTEGMNLFWLGHCASANELFISSSSLFLVFFLCRSDLIVNLSTLLGFTLL
jgi:NADH-quinone oxidoreductase subunit N